MHPGKQKSWPKHNKLIFILRDYILYRKVIGRKEMKREEVKETCEREKNKAKKLVTKGGI